MRARTIAVGATLALFAGSAAAVEYAVKMRDLARNPADYVGNRVVISDCLMISFSTILGAQCSVEPIDGAVLVYVDAETLAPAGLKLADGCSTMDPARMCILKVTGDVALNYRQQPIIMQATLEVLRRPIAI